MRILFFDLETAPNLVYTFNTFKTTIGMNQIVEPARVICASYQWSDQKKVKFVSEFHNGRREMLQILWDLFDEADVVVGYNNKGFDDAWLTSEWIAEGFTPPSPAHSVDLYQVIKRKTKFPSKKLGYVAPRLVEESKVTHSGFDLWIGCMNWDAKSWATMKRYCVQDTALLKPLYENLLPWITTHPNLGLDSNLEHACPRCGSDDVQRRGFSRTSSSVFQRFRCNKCGGWSRSSHRVATTALRGE